MLTPYDEGIRKGRITATRMVMIMTGAWGGPMRAWLEIKGRAAPFEAGYLLRRGAAIEPAIASLYKDDYGEDFTKAASTVHPDFDYLCATPDGFVRYEGERCIAEIKAPYMMSQYGENETDDVPNGVLVQTAVQMSCCKLQRSINIVDKITSLNRYIIDRSPRLESIILERAARFWRDYIVADKTPDVDGSAEYSRYLNDCYSEFKADVIDGSEKDGDHMEEYLALKSRIKDEMEPRKSMLRNLIVKSIGAYNGVETDNHKATLSRCKGKKSIDQEKMIALMKELGATDEQIDGCRTQGNGYSQLRVKEILP